MKFSGVTILQGVEFFIFPIDFEWAYNSAALLRCLRYNFKCLYLPVQKKVQKVARYDNFLVFKITAVWHLGCLNTQNFNGR